MKSQLETWKRTIQPVGANIPFYESIGNHEQVGKYFKVETPHLKEGEYYIQFTGTVGENSAEAIFAEEFVNPSGSSYGLDVPNPEAKGSSDMGGAEYRNRPTKKTSTRSITVGSILYL